MNFNENHEQPSAEAISEVLAATEDSLRAALIAVGLASASATEMALVAHEAGFRYAVGGGLVQTVSPQLARSRAASPPLDRNWMEVRESITVQYHVLNIEETQLGHELPLASSHGWFEDPHVPEQPEPVMMIADEEAGVVVYPGTGASIYVASDWGSVDVVVQFGADDAGPPPPGDGTGTADRFWTGVVHFTSEFISIGGFDGPPIEFQNLLLPAPGPAEPLRLSVWWTYTKPAEPSEFGDAFHETITIRLHWAPDFALTTDTPTAPGEPG